MKFTIEIEAENLEGFLCKLSALAGAEKATVEEKGPEQLSLFSQPVEEKEAEKVESKEKEAETFDFDTESSPIKKPERKKKVAAKKEPEVEVPSVSIDDCTEALKELNATKGINEARDALNKFDSNRISELDPKVYKDFVDFCKARIGA